MSDDVWEHVNNSEAEYFSQIDENNYIVYEDLKANFGNMFDSNYLK